MAVFSALRSINTAQSFEDVFKAKDITSPEMLRAIMTWFSLYFDDKTDDKQDGAQRIPYIIIDGLGKAVFSEYGYSIDEGKLNGKQIKATLDNLDNVRNKAFQWAGIGGEILLKPVMKRGNFVFLVINRSNMVVLARDSEGNITDLATCEITVKSEESKSVYYQLLERRTVDNQGKCTVENRLYKSDNVNDIGSSVPLGSISEYADLQPTFCFPLALDGTGLISVKMPTVNCVDGSQDGVSIYAAAVKEILKLYDHETRSQDEYDLTAPHLVASIDVQRRDKNGRLIEIPKYITPLLDEDPTEAGLQIWNPKPNQSELEARDDQIKRAIENIIGLRRGFLSKSDVQEFTATEILSTTTKMAHLIKDLQMMWESVLPETVRVCSLLAQMYNLIGWTAADPPEVVIEWGDGILYDEEKEFTRLNLMTAQGKLKDEYLLGWYYDMPTDTPEDLQAIREKYMPENSGEVGADNDKV